MAHSYSRLLFASLLLLLIAPTAVLTADDEAPGAGEKLKTVGVLFPASDFYPRYIADPLRPQNALTIQWLSDTEIPETSNGRFGLRLGGSLGIYRWHPEGELDRGWQLSFEGGFAGQFDIGNSWDNTGWDGFYGITLAWMVTEDLGFKIGSQHNSSHVGDEYWQRVGQPPIHYTREAGILGVSWTFSPKWNTYLELGYGNGQADTVTMTVESGIQYISEQRYWKGRASWYAAFDARTYEESDWRVRATAQVGYYFPVGIRGSTNRIAVELGTGRSVMGQFNELDESWIGIGWYYDF
jgi:hypothetical protein